MLRTFRDTCTAVVSGDVRATPLVPRHEIDHLKDECAFRTFFAAVYGAKRFAAFTDVVLDSRTDTGETHEYPKERAEPCPLSAPWPTKVSVMDDGAKTWEYHAPRVPRLSLKNRLYRGRLPDEFADLTWIEEMVCGNVGYQRCIERRLIGPSATVPKSCLKNIFRIRKDKVRRFRVPSDLT